MTVKELIERLKGLGKSLQEGLDTEVYIEDENGDFMEPNISTNKGGDVVLFANPE